MLNRYEKQVEHEEQAYQQQRCHLYAEVQAEKDRLADQALRQQEEIEKLQRGIEESSKYVIDRLKEEYDKEKNEQERRHKVSLISIPKPILNLCNLSVNYFEPLHLIQKLLNVPGLDLNFFGTDRDP